MSAPAPAASPVLVVPSRFCGPPGSGNGGWVSGALAARLDPEPGLSSAGASVEVTLRRPPPLDRPLAVAVSDGRVTLTDPAGAEPALVAEAVVTTLEPSELGIPGPVAPSAARAAESSYAGLGTHPFPTCFVCGPDRGDGLRLQPGPVGEGQLACAWDAAPWAGPDGTVPSELVWAALDCPGGWSAITAARAAVLGRYAVRQLEPVRGDGPLVVQGWLREWQGRKALVATALRDGTGRLLAVARATWVAVDRPG